MPTKRRNQQERGKLRLAFALLGLAAVFIVGVAWLFAQWFGRR